MCLGASCRWIFSSLRSARSSCRAWEFPGVVQHRICEPCEILHLLWDFQQVWLTGWLSLVSLLLTVMSPVSPGQRWAWRGICFCLVISLLKRLVSERLLSPSTSLWPGAQTRRGEAPVEVSPVCFLRASGMKSQRRKSSSTRYVKETEAFVECAQRHCSPCR